MQDVRTTVAVWALTLSGCVGPAQTADREPEVEAVLDQMRADAPSDYPALSEAPDPPTDLPPPSWFQTLAESLHGRLAPLEEPAAVAQDHTDVESNPEGARDGKP